MKTLDIKKCSQVFGGGTSARQCARLWRRYDNLSEYDHGDMPNNAANRVLDKIIRLGC